MLALDDVCSPQHHESMITQDERAMDDQVENQRDTYCSQSKYNYSHVLSILLLD